MTESRPLRSWIVTPWATFFGSRRVVRGRMLIALALALLIVTFGVLAHRARTQYAIEERWKSELEALGARAITAGYSSAPFWIGRVPILGEFVSYRRQLELFLDNPATVDAVLDKAAELPQLRRIWVDLTVFDRSMAKRIEEKFPGMDMIFFTPANSSASTSPGTTEAITE